MKARWRIESGTSQWKWRLLHGLLLPLLRVSSSIPKIRYRYIANPENQFRIVARNSGEEERIMFLFILCSSLILIQTGFLFCEFPFHIYTLWNESKNKKFYIDKIINIWYTFCSRAGDGCGMVRQWWVSIGLRRSFSSLKAFWVWTSIDLMLKFYLNIRLQAA